MAGGAQGGGGRPAVGGNMQQFQNALQNYRQGSAGMPSQVPGANLAAPGGGMQQGMTGRAPMPQGFMDAPNGPGAPQMAQPAYAGPAPGAQQMFYGGPPQGMPQGPIPQPLPQPQAPMPPQGQAPISVGAFQMPPAPQGPAQASYQNPMYQNAIQQVSGALPQGQPMPRPMPRPIPQGMPQVMGNPNAMPLQRPQMGQTRPMMLRGRR